MHTFTAFLQVNVSYPIASLIFILWLFHSGTFGDNWQGCDGVRNGIRMLSDSDNILQIRNPMDFQTHLDSDSAIVLDSLSSPFVATCH